MTRYIVVTHPDASPFGSSTQGSTYGAVYTYQYDTNFQGGAGAKPVNPPAYVPALSGKPPGYSEV